MVCCCVLAGTAACQHCKNNPYATTVDTNSNVVITSNSTFVADFARNGGKKTEWDRSATTILFPEEY